METNDERQAYLDEMVRRRGYVLPYHKVMAAYDLPVLQRANDLLDACYLDQRRLDRKTKELLLVVCLTALRSQAGHIKSHVRAAIEAGASPEEILEAIETVLPAAGVVAFQWGLDAWREVVGAQGIEPGVAAYDSTRE